MNFLDNVRRKPLPERKRLVWILAIASVAIIVVAWLTFFNEWKLPEMDISQSGDLQELVNNTKDTASSIQEQIGAIQQTTEEVTQLAAEQSQEEMQETTFTKKNVAVTFLNWRRESGYGLVTVKLHNLAEQPVTFKTFVLRQGYEEISAPIEETLAPAAEKEAKIAFFLPNDNPVTAFEIRDVSFTPDESWNYLFAIHDTTNSNPATSATPTPTPAETPTPTATPETSESPEGETGL